MKVLILSTNTLPASPSGPAYVAGAVGRAGHQVAIFESLFSADVGGDLKAELDRFRSDVVGVSIRLVHGDVQISDGPLGTRYLDLRPRVREMVCESDSVANLKCACALLGLMFSTRSRQSNACSFFAAVSASNSQAASFRGSRVTTPAKIVWAAALLPWLSAS